MIDFGIVVFKHHVLAQTTRQVARQAIVHGDLATELGSWGPAPINVNGNDAGEIGTFVRDRCLVLLEPASVNIHIDWPDGGNSVQAHDRVHVTVSAPRN